MSSNNNNDLATLFIEKEREIIRQAELAAEATNDHLAVMEYASGRIAGFELTPIQERRKEVYEFIISQLRSGKYSDRDVIRNVKTHFNKTGAEASHFLRNAQEMDTKLFSINKMFEAKTQMALLRIQMQKADKKGDQKAWAMLDKNYQKYLEMIPDEEAQVHDDFKGHNIIPHFAPELLGIEPIPQSELKKLMKDIEKQYGGKVSISMAEDIEFTEVKKQRGIK